MEINLPEWVEFNNEVIRHITQKVKEDIAYYKKAMGENRYLKGSYMYNAAKTMIDRPVEQSIIVRYIYFYYRSHAFVAETPIDRQSVKLWKDLTGQEPVRRQLKR